MDKRIRVYKLLAAAVGARLRSIETWNTVWQERHENRIKMIETDILPHGSGFDVGCNVDLDRSMADRIVIVTSFHHMSDAGYYTRWTDHDVIVTPSLEFDFHLRITGRNHRDIKDYIGDVFGSLLASEVIETADRIRFPQQNPVQSI